MVANTIEKTMDYSIFKTISGNRSKKPAHSKKLMASISKNPIFLNYNPILVNDEMEIIDGQHRLEAIKQLAEQGEIHPVYYIKANHPIGLEAVQLLNANQKPWSPVDYAESYVAIGKKDYQTYLDFKRDYGLNHEVILSYLSTEDYPITGVIFQSGDMKVGNLKRSKQLADDLMSVADAMGDRKKFLVRGYTTAFKKLWENNPDYDRVRMAKQAQNFPELFTSPRDWKNALEELAKVYNHYQTVKFTFRYEI